MPASPGVVWWLARIDRALVPLVALIAGIALLGWTLGSRLLVGVVSTAEAGVMMPLTATGLLLGAGALALLRPTSPRRARRRAGRALAVAIALLGLLVLAEYLFGLDPGFDRLLFPHRLHELGVRQPGRPSPESAVCFALIGAALLTLDVERSGRRPAQALAVLAALLGLLTLTGYGYGQPTLLAPTARGKVPAFTPMAIHTAVAFLALALGVLFARPDRGLMATFSADDVGGVVARRLLPAAIGLPLLLGWLRLAAENAGVLSHAFGTALLMVVLAVLLTAVVGRSAATLSRLDAGRTEAEAALRASEARFRAIFEGAAVGIVLADPDGTIVTCNAAFARMLGRAEAELRGRLVPEIVHPDDAAAAQAAMAGLLAGERDRYQAERRYLRDDGGVVWARVTASALREGGRLQAIALFEDVTARREAEETSRRLAEILQITPDFVGTATPGGRVVYLNDAARRMLGLRADEDVSGFTIPDAHPAPAARLVLQEGIPAAMREGWWRGETALRARDGREIPVLQAILAHRDPDGRVVALSTIMRDIGEQRRREDRQRFLTEAGRALGASLDPDAVLAALGRLVVPGLADHCLVDWTRTDGRMARALAVHRDPAQAAAVERLGEAAWDEGLPLGIARALRAGQAELVADVTPAWLHAAARDEADAARLVSLAPASAMFVPLRAGDRISGALTLVRAGARYGPEDVALVSALAELLAPALENARTFELREEATGVVARGLRGPLKTIATTAEALLADEAQPDRRRRLESIERSAARAARLVEDLLAAPVAQGDEGSAGR